MYSDHNLVVAKLRMRPAALNNTSGTYRRFDVSQLKNPSKLEEYKARLRENINNIPAPGSWYNVAAACSSAAEDSLGFLKNKVKPWIRPETWQSVERKRLVKSQLHSTHDSTRKTELAKMYKQAEAEIKERALKDKEVYYNNIASEAEAAAYRNDLRSVYVAVK